ncbi:hypothetical protein ACLOJK_026168 [Asimina triloba]
MVTKSDKERSDIEKEDIEIEDGRVRVAAGKLDGMKEDFEDDADAVERRKPKESLTRSPGQNTT